MYQLIQEVEAITARNDMSVADRMDALLTLGTKEIMMETGVVSQIRGDVYRISRCHSPNGVIFGNGKVYNIRETYGDLLMRESGLVAIDVFRESDYRSHLAYRTLRQECYIGVPLIVNGKIFGGFELMSQRARAKSFANAEIDLLYVMGASLSELIERDMRLQTARATRQMHRVDVKNHPERAKAK